MMQPTRSGWRGALIANWFYLLIAVGLAFLPQIIGLITGDSPFGVRGRPIGQSIFWQGVLIEVFLLAVLAMSYNLLFGFTGVISFGHALFFGAGGYVIGLALEYTELGPELSVIVGVIIALVVSAGLALLIGLASLRLRGVYFAVFTLAVAELFFIFFGRLPLTFAEDGFSITDLPTWIDPIRNRLGFYYIALVLMIVTFLFLRRLIYSPTGAVMLAIRENEERAKTIGYNTLRYKLIAIMIAGMLAALAGILQALFTKKVGPELLGLTYTIDPLLMTIIGGAGTFAGPVVGATGIHLTDRLLRDREIIIGATTIDIGASWALILGILFIIVVLVLPQGIVGTWNRWRAARQAQTTPPPPPSARNQRAIETPAAKSNP
ncbi:MAG: branched-chain amino acid ABC transporter permease [Chloroflexi bacterium]|nr:branched-chain amino acid ABC transporter permease [Chloroflexota bacterium]